MTWLRSRLRAGHGGGSKTDTCRELFQALPLRLAPVRSSARSRKALRHTFSLAASGTRRRDCRAGGARVRHHVRPGARRPRRGSGHEERVGPTGRDRARACVLEICPRARRGRARVPAPAAKPAPSPAAPSASRAVPARDPGAFLPVGVKRKPDGSLNPSAKKFRPAADAAAAAAKAKAAAKAELEAKLAAAKAEAEAMKREIAERAASARRRKDAAAKEAEARAALRRKEAALAKAERAKAASNLLSGFAGARKRTGRGRTRETRIRREVAKVSTLSTTRRFRN